MALRVFDQVADWQPDAGSETRLREDLPPGSFAYIPGHPIIGTEPAAIIADATTVSPSAYKGGIGIEGSASSSRLPIGRLPRVRASVGVTLVAQFVVTTTAIRYVAGTVNTGTSYIEDLGINLNAVEANSPGLVQILVRQDGTPASPSTTNSGACSSAAILDLGILHTLVWQFSGAGDFRLFLDGVERGTTVSYSAYSDDAGGLTEFPMTLLNRNVRNAFGNGGSGLKLGLYARLASAGLDGKAISADPWRELIEPRRIWVPVSAGGGGFQAAWARQQGRVVGAGVI